MFANLAKYPGHYSDTLSQEYIDLTYRPVRHMVQGLIHPGAGRLLDICCGTGILAELLQDVDGLDYLGVDIDKARIGNVRTRMAGLENFRFEEADFFAFDAPDTFNVVMLIKGYHHFENTLKSQVMRNVHNFMTVDGSFLLYDICIGRHTTQSGFAKANKDYFEKRIAWAETAEPMGPKKRAAWEKACNDSIAADGEYKVDHGYISRDLDENGFAMESETRIWPPPGEELFDDPLIGEFLFHTRKKPIS